MIASAAGNLHELDAGEHEHEARTPIRSARSGTRIERCEPTRTPGIEPTSSQLIACRSTLPWSRCPAPATQSSSAAWSMSVPTIRVRRQRVSRSSIASPKNVPEPTDVSPTMNPQRRADHDRDHLVARAEQERRRRLALRDRRNVFASEAEAAEDQRAADDLAHRRLVPRRENELAIWTPTSESGAEPTSIHSASRACTLPSCRWRTAPNDLKIGAVEDVGADRGLRVEAEEQDQHRRHQLAAAHPGHADEHADREAGDRRTARSCASAARDRAGDERPAA